MNSRERFLESDAQRIAGPGAAVRGRHPGGGAPAWRKQGLPARTRLEKVFAYDEYIELNPRLYPPRSPLELAGLPDGLERLQHSLDCGRSAQAAG